MENTFAHSFITCHSTRLIFQKYGSDHITQKTWMAPYCVLNKPSPNTLARYLRPYTSRPDFPTFPPLHPSQVKLLCSQHNLHFLPLPGRVHTAPSLWNAMPPSTPNPPIKIPPSSGTTSPSFLPLSSVQPSTWTQWSHLPLRWLPTLPALRLPAVRREWPLPSHIVITT